MYGIRRWFRSRANCCRQVLRRTRKQAEFIFPWNNMVFPERRCLRRAVLEYIFLAKFLCGDCSHLFPCWLGNDFSVDENSTCVSVPIFYAVIHTTAVHYQPLSSLSRPVTRLAELVVSDAETLIIQVRRVLFAMAVIEIFTAVNLRR